MKYADLHIHSNFSDSSFNCEDIFKRASSYGLSCISIVDHDSLEAYSSEDITSLAEKYSVEIIKGIEFSSQHKDKEIHLLGYFSDRSIEEEFLLLLKKIKNDRMVRISEIINKLKDLKVVVDPDEFKDFTAGASLSRLHLATFLTKKRLVKDIKEAFSKYLGVGKEAYVSRFRYELPEAIKILNRAGALVFLAHPFNTYTLDQIKEFIPYGLAGIEVFYPFYSQATIESYKSFAEENGILITGGSDSHGRYKRHIIGAAKLPYEYVEQIKQAFKT
ncbi:MAG: PHP domain-containing protein [Candidatus Omnitrophica bacterium]|nr:PHP domain-containing protein [Candidatus Omnitrophota bacterium]